MDDANKIIGICFATNVDRLGLSSTVRGMLEFLDEPIAKRITDVMLKSKIDRTVLYTNYKGKSLREVMNEKVRYVIKGVDSMGRTNTISEDFSIVMNKYRYFFCIDAKYPLIDEYLINELIDFHIKNQCDASYIECTIRASSYIPTIAVINNDKFIELFLKGNVEIKHPTMMESIKVGSSLGYNIKKMSLANPVKITPFTSQHKIDELESLLLFSK